MQKVVPPPNATTQSLVQHVLTSRHDIVELLSQLRRARAVLTCFIEGGAIPVGARIGTTPPAADALILVPVSDIEHRILAAASKVTAVVSMQGVRIQFDSTVAGSVETLLGEGVRMSMPAGILRLQRRAHNRTRPPRVRPLECTVRGETNQPSQQRLVVLDIGIGGVALLGRTEDRYAAGERLLNCSFNLGKEGGFTTDLLVRHVGRAEGSGGWHYGCSFAGITARALERVCSYVERIEAQRRDALVTIV
jgi:c-di-GMP-binding flagellar brake protein YcgR